MKLLPIWILIGLAIAVQPACKKHTDTPAPAGPTLADTLRAICISPFVGHGDSSSIYFPTAFTPNGDGLNDIYRPLGMSIAPGNFSNIAMKIYDTTGTMVYQSSGTEIPAWDGVDQNTHAKSRKYKYYVQLKYTTSGHVSDSGNTYLYLLSGTSCVNAVSADTVKYRFPAQFDPTTGFNSAWPSFETYCH